MSIDLSAFSMVALFRMEAGQLTGGMATALIDLEADPARTEHIATLMRGAHSLKGAARIADVDPLVHVAHAMEDRLSEAQRAAAPLAPAHLEALLQGTDVFARAAQIEDADLPAWLAAQETGLERLIQVLTGDVPAVVAVVPIAPAAAGAHGAASVPVAAAATAATAAAVPAVTGTTSAASASAALTTDRTVTPAVATPVSAPSLSTTPTFATPVHAAPTSAAPAVATPLSAAAPLATSPLATPLATSPPGPPQPSPPAPGQTPGHAPGHAPDRQLRLDATQLDALLGLARESLLVNRAHQRQGEHLQRVRTAQRQLARTVERLHEAVQAQGSARLPPDRFAEQLAALVEAAGQASRRSTQALDQHIHEHATQTRRGHRIATRLHHSIHGTRMTRFGEAAALLKRVARDTGQRLGKPVVLELQGADTRIDRDVLDRIEAPLMHMVRNAIDHGLDGAAERLAAGKPPAGRLTVAARHHRGQLEVSVSDDGRGVDVAALRQRVGAQGLAAPALLAQLSEAELLDFLFLPRFSTRDAVSETSGRGVGLDVVQSSVQALGGRLRVVNRPGAGLSITLVLPVSLSLVRALLLQVGSEVYGLPLSQLERVLSVPVGASQSVAGRPVALLDGRELPWTPLGPILGLAAPPPAPLLTLVEIASPRGRFAFAVDALLGERDLSLQALDARLAKPVHIAAAAVLDDGTPLLVLDVADLANAVADGAAGAPAAVPSPAGAPDDGAGADMSAAAPRAAQRVLVVEDSFTVREVERKVLAGGGYAVDTAVDGVEGWNALCARSYDLVVTDIDMPRMNGLELLRRIRANAQTSALPVMIVSYKDREQDRMAGLQAGADRYFVKSGFEAAALLEAVADLIG